MGGLTCPHVDYIMVQYEICPGAKKTYFLGVACTDSLGVTTLDKVLASKNFVQNFAFKIPASSDMTGIIMSLNSIYVSGAAKARAVAAVFSLPK